ncbi:MAG: DNA-directed RNA polymerase subunit alpha [Gemmatimonadetes bacterium]|jgi:DNA-directed RNA polymerase subunit alpha|nr:DNA-directed RNA polymerase subunit alpha [Gemmatimonadota bacterium]HCK10578.1 DNA-directed RNA polymerase subunit alpha [Candidatus Latescibacterota bacterium]|tara:strand:+ start:297 stop:1313 length:1017 start_codon:yes stop_codon:yes gene_type:complete
MKPKNFQMPRSVQVDEESLKDSYGKFTVQPLERGFGTTIGNALRRVLLSSIEGAAIKAVKIEGVQHEFSTLEGVVEDMTEVILNLKEVNIRLLEGEEKIIHVKKEGGGDLKASDLQTDAQIEVMNPDQHIASLDRDGVLDMEVTVAIGRGYVLSENNKTTDQPMGTIALDTAFSPVRKIHYEVDNARVGQQTDYDKLTLEVWTNGGVPPDDAVAHAAKTLKDHLELFINFDDDPEPEQEEVVDEATQRVAQLLKMQVEELELSVRSANCLKAADIMTLEDLVVRPESEMLKFRNFGRKSLNELNAILEELGLSFGMEIGQFKDIAPKIESVTMVDEDF